MKTVSRRQYFHSLLSGAVNIVDELRGTPHFQLDHIGSLPEDALRRITPVVRQDITLSIQDDWLLLQNGPGEPFTRHMPLTAHQIAVLNCFDGRHSMAGVCGVMESAFGLPPDEASELVRSLFMTLAGQGLCHPMEPPE